jgi:hypothetical protein
VEKMKIVGVSHPIPTEYAKRIYNENKTVYVGKSYRGKVSKGDKFVIYESYGAKAYTGWANIVKVAGERTFAATRLPEQNACQKYDLFKVSYTVNK